MMDADYRQDFDPSPRRPPCANHPERESLMRWHEKALCQECYMAAWPEIRTELRAQQLVIGGLPEKRAV